MTPLLAWVSLAAVARSLTRGRALATRLITVGGLYLLAIMVIAAYLPPLRELYFLLLSYTTLLFTYFEGRTGGRLVFHGDQNVDSATCPSRTSSWPLTEVPRIDWS